MAATLAPSVTTATLERAIRRLTPGSVAWQLVAAQLDADAEHRAEVYAEDGYVRMLENRGTYAGSQEESDDRYREFYGVGFPV